MTNVSYGKFFNIDKARNKSIEIKLEDSNGDEVKIEDILSELNIYLEDKLKSTEVNVCTQQIYPVLTEILTKSITTAFKDQTLGIATISQPEFRSAFLWQMLLTFYFMKFLQKNDIKIISIEKDMDKEDIDRILKQDRISSYIITAQMSGLSNQDIIKAILDTGAMSREELIETKMFREEDIEKCILKQ